MTSETRRRVFSVTDSPGHSNRFPPWRKQTGSGVLEWFLVWHTCFHDGLQLAEIGQVKYRRHHFQDGGSKPEVGTFLYRILGLLS